MTLPLLFETEGAVVTITLNRPDRHNAFSPEMICRLAEAFDRFEADPALRVAVLTGAGTRSFCSGGDLELTLPLLSGARAPETEWDHKLIEDRSLLFRSTLKGVLPKKPIIAAVNGHCLAGGFELMLACDIRIASDEARFGLPEAQHALIPFAGALVRLPRQLPQAIAMEMLLTGDQIAADRLHHFGLINHLVPAKEVLSRALDLAERIAANGPLAVSQIKDVAQRAFDHSQLAGFDRETAAMDLVMGSADAREGPKAFMERRRPVYTGS